MPTYNLVVYTTDRHNNVKLAAQDVEAKIEAYNSALYSIKLVKIVRQGVTFTGTVILRSLLLGG